MLEIIPRCNRTYPTLYDWVAYRWNNSYDGVLGYTWLPSPIWNETPVLTSVYLYSPTERAPKFQDIRISKDTTGESVSHVARHEIGHAYDYQKGGSGIGGRPTPLSGGADFYYLRFIPDSAVYFPYGDPDYPDDYRMYSDYFSQFAEVFAEEFAMVAENFNYERTDDLDKLLKQYWICTLPDVQSQYTRGESLGRTDVCNGQDGGG